MEKTMKTRERLDLEEMERLKICKHNLELMQRHIKRLENYVFKVEDILSIESMGANYKINAIARITDTVKEFI